jgi:hypothetical protein
MEQGTARRRAKEISQETGRIAVADTVRSTPAGWVRGGWPSVHHTWAVFDWESGHLIELDPPEGD